MTFTLKNVSEQGILITWFNSGSQHSHTINSGATYSFTADVLSNETLRLISLGMLIVVTGTSPAVRIDTKIGSPLIYRGPYSATVKYKTGNTAMFAGSLWLSIREQYATSPVENPDGWFNLVAGVDVSSHYVDYNNPHNTTADQVGAISTSLLGAADGVAPLDGDSKIPEAYLPESALGHVQNSDTKLASGTGNEVTASALRAHLAMTSGNPHGLTAAMISAIESSLMAQPLGVATLDATGKLSANQIPTIDGIDVRVVENNTERDALSGSLGTSALVAVEDEGKVYSWSGSTFTDVTETHAWTFFINGKQGVSITLTTDDIAEDNGKYYFTNGRLIAASPFQEVYTVRHTQNTDAGLAIGTGDEVTAADIRAHLDSTGNPHSVTPSQIGALADVSDDTSPQLAADLDATGHLIINLAAPVAASDAATKAYVDSVAVSGVSDGDKGGITVSSGGTVWTVDDASLTYAKIQNISTTQRVLGRTSPGAGVTEELSVTNILDWLGSVHGTLLFRGASGWDAIDPGVAGYVLTTGGDGVDPYWSALSLVDGDYGDIVVSAGGTAINIDTEAVTFDKIQQISGGGRVMGRKAASGNGVPEEVTLTELLDDGGTLTGGEIMMRGASDWAPLTAGTAGYTLISAGPGAPLVWGQLGNLADGTYGPITITSGVWAISDGDYGDFTATAGVLTIDGEAVTFAKMQEISSHVVIGNNTGGVTSPGEVSASQILDWLGTAAHGQVLFRGAAGWEMLDPGADGAVFTTHGAAADPTWETPAGGGDVVGPTGATDSALAIYDGTTGKLLKDGLGTNATTAPTLNLGTVTDTTNRGLTINQVWDNAGLIASALTIDVTNTNSHTASALTSWRVAGTNVAYVRKDGTFLSGLAGSAASPNFTNFTSATTGLWSNANTSVGLTLAGSERFSATSTVTNITGTTINVSATTVNYTSSTNAISNNYNGSTVVTVANNSGGTAAQTNVTCGNGTSNLIMGMLGTGYTTNGGLVQGAGILVNSAAAGLSLIQNNASGSMRFYTGGFADANLRVEITSAGAVQMKSGSVEVGVAGTTAGILSFLNNTSGSIAVRTRAGVALGTVTVYLPAVDGVELGFRNIPQNIQSGAYTTVLQDSGKHILHPSADTTARTYTIDSDANVPYEIGTAITFINQDGAGVLTIAIASDTMRLAGPGTTGSRTLAANGVATAVKITATEWIISGTNLT